MPCIKAVDNKECQCCQSPTVKFGKTGTMQRYRCKNCKKTQIRAYQKNACKPGIDESIASHLVEGCGIRSIARLLNISATTVVSPIQKIACSIKKPAILTEKVY